MAASTLIDTDILMDVLRGHVPALHYLRSLPDPFALSAASVGEVAEGLRDGRERAAFLSLLNAVTVVPVDAAIATRAGFLRRDFGESHGVTLADGLIAATAERLNLQLATLHPRHYPSLKRVTTPYRKT